MIRRKENQANALVELVILLPLYVLILLGLIYIGDLSGIRTRLQPTAEQAAICTQDISAATLEEQMFSLYPEGNLTLIEKSDKGSFPPSGEIRYILEYLADPPQRPWASGSWQIQGGQLVPVIHTGYHTGTGDARARNLIDDTEPELLEQTMEGYMNEVSARAHFSYDAGYIQIGPVELTRLGELEAEHSADARGELERTVAGGGYGHPTEELMENLPEWRPLQDYPNFREYPRELWLPDLKPKE